MAVTLPYLRWTFPSVKIVSKEGIWDNEIKLPPYILILVIRLGWETERTLGKRSGMSPRIHLVTVVKEHIRALSIKITPILDR
jgi:hypothetical protein